MTGDDHSSARGWRDPWLTLGLLGTLLGLSLLFIHVPATMWAGNVAEFESSYRQILGVGVAALVVSVALAGVVLRLLPRGLRALIASLLCALALLAWIYAYFIVGHMTVLNGQQAPMDFNTGVGVLGVWELPIVAIVWIALAFVVWRSPRLIRLVLISVNVALCVGTFVTVIKAADVPTHQRPAPDTARLFRFSPRGNVLVILLDALQSDIADAILQRDASLRDAFEGFQFYKNTLSAAPTTFLSLPSIHSGESWQGQPARAEGVATTSSPAGAGVAGGTDGTVGTGGLRSYFHESIEHRSFLTRFVNGGYDATLINPLLGLCPDGVSTCVDAARVLHSPRTLLLRDGLRLLDLSLFRVTPVWVKRHIFANGRWRAIRLAGAPFEIDRIFEGSAWLREMAHRIEVRDGDGDGGGDGAGRSGRPTIKFLHLFATHPPFVLEDDCQTVAAANSTEHAASQARCGLRAVADLFASMKRAGVYDDTVILVLADHGIGQPSRYLESPTLAAADWINLSGASNPLFLLKPRDSHGPLTDAPATDAVYLPDVGATLCAATNACETTNGFAAGHAPPNRPRRFNSYVWQQEFWDARELPAVTPYDVVGPVWRQDSWSKTGPVPTYRLGDTITFGVAGTSDPYLQFGWAAPEPWGRWTASQVAQITLHLAGPIDDGLELIAHVSAFTPPAHPSQTATLTVNDQALATWTFTSADVTERHVQIPRELLAGSAELRLSVRVASPVSPQDVGISADPRHLGLAFRELKLIAQH